MTLDTITKGEELLKKATPGPWREEVGAAYKDNPELAVARTFIGGTARNHSILTEHDGGSYPVDDLRLIIWLRNHASELLQCAREVEGLKARIEVLENPLPTQEEEREFYHRAYHVCHTGCPTPCPNRT